MSLGSDDRTYVDMMVESLQKKKKVLTSLYELTREQETLLKDEEMDVDRFSEITEAKGQDIEELDSLDAGFDGLYRKLEQELTKNRGAYEAEITHMKALISDITTISSRIQALEKKNYEMFQIYMKNERMKLRRLNTSQKTAQNYAKNMSGSHRPENSYFVNETK